MPLVVLTMREPPSVVAALAAGMRLPLVRPHHLMPNTVAPKIDQATGICCSAMPAATIREFPGPGIPPEIPFGSNRMAAGWAGLRIITWIIVCPGIALAVLAVDTVGDQLLHPLDPQLATKVRARSPAPPRPPSSAP